MANDYDLVILGGGIGGYTAAIRAAQEGLTTAIVEKDKLGGTCLHKGCIPSKSLLRSAEVFSEVKDSSKYGISVKDPSIDFGAVQDRKEAIVNDLYTGVQHLMNKRKIDVYQGLGRILGPSIFSPSAGTISVENNDGSENELLVPKNVIIATGSRPRILQGLEPDGKTVLTSDEALNMEELPSSMIIIGGGVIGVEWASLLSDFGVDVTVVESASQLLPHEEAEIARELTKRLKERGVQVLTDAKVMPEKTGRSDSLSLAINQKGEEKTIQAEKVLLSVGREAIVDDIGLDNTNITLTNGAIAVNDVYQTQESHIYAVGDVIGGMQLAHVAAKEGIIAVEHMCGLDPAPLSYTSVPKCTYSRPEVASIGLTEAEAKEQGYTIKTGSFSFRANGKALVHGDGSGFVKFIANEENDDLLGIHMIGPQVTELISEAALAKLVDASNFEMSEIIHPHPALSEVLGEGALAVEGKAIHS
ncbi:dihydrolipoyl dehydrogenase [Alteribacillus iranensis]|uniref:Dihydrolipoyl dehydrogenase n=1 Tax=Alteribacillus iranensis TaxID=930128 RepID=A0A1I1ZIQ2_9BACI|nr:dihydrolipoyl dehydrogenase [Alteribacillus iranensis]SFE31579.1 dihydrolipoamide dehydrogenase [Alteribacillus iranensis]